MSRPKLMICLGFTAVFAYSFTASAQDTAPDVPSESGPSMVTMASEQQSPSSDRWLQENLEDAKQRSRRARNALIAIGMIASGIVLGMSNKRKREIQRQIHGTKHGRRLQWDIPRGVLTF